MLFMPTNGLLSYLVHQFCCDNALFSALYLFINFKFNCYHISVADLWEDKMSAYVIENKDTVETRPKWSRFREILPYTSFSDVKKSKKLRNTLITAAVLIVLVVIFLAVYFGIQKKSSKSNLPQFQGKIELFYVRLMRTQYSYHLFNCHILIFSQLNLFTAIIWEQRC